jgi:antagonist of KipI
LIVVERAPPYLTVQDGGRPGYRASGVPPGGAMDPWSLSIANILVGNDRNTPGLEWAIGGGVLRFAEDIDIALAGAHVEATLDGTRVATGTRISAQAGQVLAIDRLLIRRFVYVAVSGGVNCPTVLGSKSTYLPAALGGIEGRRVTKGDIIPTTDVPSRAQHAGVAIGSHEGPDYDSEVIRVVASDDNRAFNEFADAGYTVSAASDRMGYRLEANRPMENVGASVTSEPVCAGAIQMPPNGQPIVLMADSPTVGGYRIIGTVITCDLPILAQCMPGRRVRFAAVSVAVAQEEIRRRENVLGNRSFKA